MDSASWLVPTRDYIWLFVLLAVLIPLPVSAQDELDRDGDIPGEW